MKNIINNAIEHKKIHLKYYTDKEFEGGAVTK